MAERVDHDERRRALVAALFGVISRDGLAAASIRAVAAEAGVPAPRVQYYFPTKAALLDAALDELARTLVGRGIALQEAAGTDASPDALVRAALTGSRPVDEHSHQAVVIFLNFLTAAITDPSIADTQLLTSQRLISSYFATQIDRAKTTGDIDQSIDAAHEANLIVWANAGLTLAALAGILTLEEATAAIDHHLARTFRSSNDG